MFVPLLFTTLSLVSAVSPPSPHIIFVLADDYGWNDIGLHQSQRNEVNPNGYPTVNASQHIQTPTLDGLGKEGVHLTGYYVQFLCTPTRGSLMTGRYPSTTGLGPDVMMPSSPYGLAKRETLLPEVLNSLGYVSHMVGKWHIGTCHQGYTPTFRGFSSWTGFFNGAEGYLAPSTVADAQDGVRIQGQDMRSGGALNVLPPPFPSPIQRGLDPKDCYDHSTTTCYSTLEFARTAIDVISQHDPSIPLFYYIAFQATHNPLVSPAEYMQPFTNMKDVPRRTFYGMTLAMDEAVGRIVDALKANEDMWRDTVFIFSTDNGGEPSVIGRGNNFPLRGGKVTVWEGGVRGVGFVRGTESKLAPLPRGVTRTQLMHVSDWLPTLAHVAAGSMLNANESEQPCSSGTATTKIGRQALGVSVVGVNTNCVTKIARPLAGLKLDGVNQWDMLSGNKTGIRNTVVHGVQKDEARAKNLVSDAIRVGDYKLVMHAPNAAPQHPPPEFDASTSGFPLRVPKPYNGSMYLFHIPSDPLETTNLAALEGARLSQLLDVYRDLQRDVVVDFAQQFGHFDATGDPRKRDDKTWGPFNDTASLCKFGKEFV